MLRPNRRPSQHGAVVSRIPSLVCYMQ
jgi:hypothetical protein